LGVVDSVIAKTGEVIAKTERLKKGLMQTLLTRGIGHKEYKQTPIGTTPKTWQIVRLGEVLELCQYGLSARFGDRGKYHILKMDDIVDGVAIPDNAKYIDLDERTFENFKLEKGDILFNRTNSYELVGRTGIFLLDGDYTFASYLIRLRPKKEIVDSLFLTYYMIFSNNRLRQLATRAVHQANINATNLQSFTIPIPPLSEQKKIAETLMTLDKKLEFERKEKAKLERIKQGLMDLLLTGKVRVKVD
jgi:type I restriction enzyme S subunit